jgi:hypothetical protein
MNAMNSTATNPAQHAPPRGDRKGIPYTSVSTALADDIVHGVAGRTGCLPRPFSSKRLISNVYSGQRLGRHHISAAADHLPQYQRCRDSDEPTGRQAGVPFSNGSSVSACDVAAVGPHDVDFAIRLGVRWMQQRFVLEPAPRAGESDPLAVGRPAVVGIVPGRCPSAAAIPIRRHRSSRSRSRHRYRR